MPFTEDDFLFVCQERNEAQARIKELEDEIERLEEKVDRLRDRLEDYADPEFLRRILNLARKRDYAEIEEQVGRWVGW
jgi:chromosome segregation ATPase